MKKTNDEKLRLIASDYNNYVVIDKAIRYIELELKTSIYNNTTLNNSINSYIYNILNKCKYNILKVYNLDRAIKLSKDNIDSYIFTSVSDKYNDNVSGYNNGLIINTVEKNNIEYLELIENHNKKVIERNLLNKSLEDNTKLLRLFIELLPQENFKYILVMHYLEGYNLNEIADKLFLTYDAVRKYKNKANNYLAQIILYFVEFKNGYKNPI